MSWDLDSATKVRVKVKQFIPPDGRETEQYTFVSAKLGPLYCSMQDVGAELHAEVLSTQEISLTVSLQGKDVDIEVVPNNEEVTKAIERLLGNRSWDATKTQPDIELADGTDT